MYKLSIPLSLLPMGPDNYHVYLEQLRRCGAQRVFLCCIDPVCEETSILRAEPQRLQDAIRYFQAAGLETGVWVSCFGHGTVLSGMRPMEDQGNIALTGVMGDSVEEAVCPLNPVFSEKYRDSICRIAAMEPDLIMLDDDFRLNSRGYYMGCFCPLHLQDFYARIGEVLPREELEARIFTGGSNPYRMAYMQMQRDTLLGFARMLREAIDAVAPRVRLGACTVLDNWDYAGTDPMEIAKALAGTTEPFLRTIGAPYWPDPLASVVEDTRQQILWSREAGVEVFTEGDTYPRPRYAVSAARLELFDLLLIADGQSDGILKYMFDYTFRPDYEEGYVRRHIKNAELRRQVRECFAGKKPVGVGVFNALHKVENWQLPDTPPKGIASRLAKAYQSPSRSILAGNSIPTAFSEVGWPILVFGENARYLPEDALKNGAILDVPAAQILQARGIDTGLVDADDICAAGEYFEKPRDTARLTGNVVLKEISCVPDTQILSRLQPGGSPGSYLYENPAGQRFFVLACDWYMGEADPGYFENYYRQEQLIDALEWLGEKRLPAVSVKNPRLYIMAAKANGAMSVALANIWDDEILTPEIRLDREYRNIRFINCSGSAEGTTVRLDCLPAFGFAVFEVYDE